MRKIINFFLIIFILSVKSFAEQSNTELITNTNTMTVGTNILTNAASNLFPHTFSCACAGNLSSAFSDFESHIFDDNLDPLSENLDGFPDAINGSIVQIEKNRINLEKELAEMKILLLKTNEFLFYLKHKTQTIKMQKNKK